MKNFFLITLALFMGLNIASAQSADPAVTGANFVPNQINTGQISVLTISFANTGSTAIPKSSIELTISTAYNYYTTNGSTAPTGPGAAFFNWTYVGVVGTSDIWKGSNKVAIDAFDGGNISLTVTGNTATTGYETTNVNVQPVDSLSKFNDAQTNNNLQPQLKINQGCPLTPVLSASTKSNICPVTTADLTTLQPAAVGGQTFEWHTMASNPTVSTFISTPTQVAAGTYYLYAKSTCYSSASSPATVTINVCTSSDLTISLGQPSPSPIAAQTSLISVTVNNIGTAPTVGTIAAVVQIPNGTTFGTFPVSNNGWTCSTSGITATCTSSAAIANAANIVFSVPFIPTAVQVGNQLVIPLSVIAGGGEVNTTNNISNTITTANTVGADLVLNFTFSSNNFTVNASKTVIINVNEIGNISTNSTPVTLFIPYSAGFTYAFNANQTSATVVNLETVNNPNWTMTLKPAGILLTLTTVIPANLRSRCALTVTAVTPGAEVNIMANLTPNGGGETNAFNNVASMALSVQK